MSTKPAAGHQGDPTPETLARLGCVRREEIDGFVEGLFHGEEEIDLPDKVSKALGVLAEIRAMMAGMVDLAENRFQPEETPQLASTLKHLAELQRVIEREMHVVVLECTRVRRTEIRDAAGTGRKMH